MNALPVSHIRARVPTDVSLTTLPLPVFCRQKTCSNLPFTDISGPCLSDQDCEGFDYAYYAPVYCGVDNRCGGTNASCRAQDGGASGGSYDCVTRKSNCAVQVAGRPCTDRDTQTQNNAQTVNAQPRLLNDARERHVARTSATVSNWASTAVLVASAVGTERCATSILRRPRKPTRLLGVRPVCPVSNVLPRG